MFTEVTPGEVASASSSGQIATTDTSCGTRRPLTSNALINSSITASLCTTTAVTSGSTFNSWATTARAASWVPSHGCTETLTRRRAAACLNPLTVRLANPVSRLYTSGGEPISATRRCPRSARCSRHSEPARLKSRSMQVSPSVSAGMPISTDGRRSSRSTGTLGSKSSTSITMIASTSEVPATRCSPATPSSWVSSSTSWSNSRAAVTIEVTNCMITGTCIPLRSGITRASTLDRLLASDLAPACGW
jgi:hypothetical protein